MKKYIIDGYNLLKSPAFNIPLNLDLEDQRNHLIRLIKSYAKFERCQIIIVFDNSLLFKGSKKISAGGEVQIQFTKPSMEADELIKIMIRKADDPGNLVVVSSDKAIQYAAKDHGSSVLSSEDYWRLLDRKMNAQQSTPGNIPEQKYQPNLGDKELEYWKRLFGQEDLPPRRGDDE